MGVIRDLTIQVKLKASGVAKGLKDLDKQTRTVAKSFATVGDGATSAAKDIGRSAKSGEASMGSLGRSVSGVSASLVGLAKQGFGAVTSALKSAVMEAVEFEATMADIAKVVPGLKTKTGEATAEFAKMKEEIFGLSSEIAIAPDGFGKIIAAAGQAGIAREELTGFAADAAKMAVAFDTTAEKSGKAMAKMRAGLGLNQVEVVSLAGSFNALGQEMAVEAKELVNVTNKVGAMAKSAGVSGKELGALAGTMIASGASSNVAATGVKNLALSLASGEAATNRQRVAFDRLGLNAEDVAKKFTAGGEDMRGALFDVLNRIKGLDQAQQAATVMQLFGKESQGAIAPLLENMDLLHKAFAVVSDDTRAATSIQDEYNVRAKTTANALQLLENNAKIAAVRVGDALLPALNELLSFASSPDAKAIGDTIIGGITNGIQELITMGTKLGESLRPVFEGLLSVGSGVLTGMSDNFERVKAALDPFLDALSRLGTLVVEALGLAGEEGEQFGESYSSALGDVAVGAVEAITAAVEVFVAVLGWIMPVLSPVVDFLKAVLITTIDKVTGTITYLKDQVTTLTDAFRAFTSGNFGEGFAKLGRFILDALLTPIRLVAKQLVDLADAVPGGSALVPAALRKFSGSTAAASASEKIKEIRKKAGKAGAAEAPAEEVAPAGPSAPLKVIEDDEPVYEKPKSKRSGGRKKKKKKDGGEFVSDADVLRALYESPAETRQRLKQEADARKGLGKAGKEMNALDSAAMSSMLGARGVKLSGSGGGGSVGPSVTNVITNFNFDIDARGNEGAAANVERAARSSVEPFSRALRGVDQAAIRAKAGGGSAAGAG